MELANGDETVTCYPVIGAGHYGWCAVGNGQDSSKEVKQYLLKLERLFAVLDRTGGSAATTAI